MLVLQDLIVNVRNLRAESRVEQKVKIPIEVFAYQPDIQEMLHQNRGAVERLANVEKITFSDNSLAKLPASRSTPRFDVRVVYEKKIDVEAERARLQKELERYEKEIANCERQLQNQEFLAKAPAHLVEGTRKRMQELAILIEKTRSKLAELT
jgi:valyl-tRNA synthetase